MPAAPASHTRQDSQPTPPLPVLWLQPMQRDLVDVTAGERADQHAHLHAAVSTALHIDHAALGGWQAQPTESSQGAALCGQCGGHCCLHGLPGHAFVDLPLLQRWADAHPGHGLDDAISAYVDFIPAQHVQRSCLYQGPRGCALPRDARSEICNTFACDALQQMEVAARHDHNASAVAVTLQRDTVLRAALVTHDGACALPLPSRPA